MQGMPRLCCGLVLLTARPRRATPTPQYHDCKSAAGVASVIACALHDEATTFPHPTRHLDHPSTCGPIQPALPGPGVLWQARRYHTCNTLETPPPPPGRVQASSWNLPPSRASTSAQRLFWACLIMASKRPRMLRAKRRQQARSACWACEGWASCGFLSVLEGSLAEQDCMKVSVPKLMRLTMKGERSTAQLWKGSAGGLA